MLLYSGDRRENALAEISETIELNKKQAIQTKLIGEEEMEDLDELENWK